MSERTLTPRQSHVMEELLRYSTIQRDAGQKVDSLIREAVHLGVPQTAVALVAGTTQASVSRLLARARTDRSGRRRRSAATTGAPGGTV